MSNVKWYPTDKHVYATIYREHHDEFTVFSSFSNPSPSELSSQPQMITEWGFKDADYPLIKSVIKWYDGKREETETRDFYIAITLKEDC